ncbi:MAG: DNA-processing protein DprA [Kiritimatiellae bacterium]|nr:DNA-processing protein DprA [Kiritimatiellia bacterium]
MTEREAAIAFNMVPDIGYVRMQALIAEAGSAAAAWEQLPEKNDWQKKPVEWEREIENAEKARIKIVTIFDEEYPSSLRDLPSPPLCLYTSGNIARLSDRCVAMVGTRSMSYYGREMAETIAYGLAIAGWTVVSGLAAGIDGAAHWGALNAHGGRTVGVLGGALDCFYPQENRDLGRMIVRQGGCVASEYPLGRKPDYRTFPQRNRIVAALVKGVVAVETPIKGGTLITCDIAADLGRCVMAVPGPANAKLSAGCHQLIRDGATLVTNVDEVVECLSELAPKREVPVLRQPLVPLDVKPLPKPGKDAPQQPPKVELSILEEAVYKHISEAGCTTDKIANDLKLPGQDVNKTLVALRMKRLIRFAPGNRVLRA